jgi:hypothetical protein
MWEFFSNKKEIYMFLKIWFFVLDENTDNEVRTEYQLYRDIFMRFDYDE